MLVLNCRGIYCPVIRVREYFFLPSSKEAFSDPARNPPPPVQNFRGIYCPVIPPTPRGWKSSPKIKKGDESRGKAKKHKKIREKEEKRGRISRLGGYPCKIYDMLANL